MINNRRLILLTILVCSCAFANTEVKAQGIGKTISGIFNGNKEEKVASAEELYDLTLEENLSLPKLGKYSEEIKEFQKSVALKFKKDKYKTQLMRNGEIIVITIPAADLFYPLDDNLTKKGEALLSKFIQSLAIPDLYRMAIVMHSDNSGTPLFTYKITKNRIENILDWFEANAKCSDYVIPYAMGDTQPMVQNNSMLNRAANRRLEIYLIPGETMINYAKKGALSNLITY